jgi:hypothetical protein
VPKGCRERWRGRKVENKEKLKHDSKYCWRMECSYMQMADENDSGGHNTLHVYDLGWTKCLEMNDGLPLDISPIFVLFVFLTTATFCIDPITTPFGHFSMLKLCSTFYVT